MRDEAGGGELSRARKGKDESLGGIRPQAMRSYLVPRRASCWCLTGGVPRAIRQVCLNDVAIGVRIEPRIS